MLRQRLESRGWPGSPSVIYLFHHKAGETRLREPISESCANPCWVWMQGHFMPAGSVKPCPMGQASGMTPVTHQRTLLTQSPGSSVAWPIKWTQGLALLDHGDPDGRYPDLRHRFNQGHETRFGPFLVDGVSYARQTILEYTGCWWHRCPAWRKNCTPPPSRTGNSSSGTGGPRPEPSGWKKGLDAG